jgi:hypothetical protein
MLDRLIQLQVFRPALPEDPIGRSSGFIGSLARAVEEANVDCARLVSSLRKLGMTLGCVTFGNASLQQ